jgi:hypothetical protein
MSALAIELGARVESALTVHVTHVVAGGFGSDKYYVGPCRSGLNLRVVRRRTSFTSFIDRLDRRQSSALDWRRRYRD